MSNGLCVDGHPIVRACSGSRTCCLVEVEHLFELGSTWGQKAINEQLVYNVIIYYYLLNLLR